MARALLFGLLTLWLLPLVAGAQIPEGAPLAEDAGVIQKLDLDGQTLVIDGMRYQMALEAEVEIGGSYGAFTMLEPGMRVYFEYRRVSSSERIITLLRELPAEVELEQV